MNTGDKDPTIRNAEPINPKDIERGPRPWEREITSESEDRRLIQEYQEKSKIETGTRKGIDLILRQEIDQRQQIRSDLIREWFTNHSNKIIGEGYDPESKDEGYIRMVVSKMGGLKEIETSRPKWIGGEGEGIGAKKEIENLAALRLDMQKDIIPLETQYLISNVLGKRIRRIEYEIAEAEVKSEARLDKITAQSKKRELDDLFKIRQELIEKSRGRNLRKEAETEMEQIEQKQLGETDEKHKERLAEKAEPVRQAIKGEWEKGSIGWFEKRIEVPGKGMLTEEEFVHHRMKESREAEIKTVIKKKIDNVETSIDKAIGDIETAYKGVKDRLIIEFTERDLGKNKKTAEQLGEIRKEFDKKGKNPTEFIGSVIERSGNLSGLTGTWDADNRIIQGFLGEQGIPVDDDKLIKFNESRRGKEYNRELANKEIGFLEWLLDLIFFIPPKKT